MSEWQPIETEIPIGRDALVVYADGVIRIAEWDEYNREHYLDVRSVLPTHWMPLPAPPEAPR